MNARSRYKRIFFVGIMGRFLMILTDNTRCGQKRHHPDGKEAAWASTSQSMGPISEAHQFEASKGPACPWASGRVAAFFSCF